MREQVKLKELTWILPGTGFFCSEDLCFFPNWVFFQSVTTFILGREKATQGKSAEGEREEPETDNRNQNSSGWGRKDFKASKNHKPPKLSWWWWVFLEADRVVAARRVSPTCCRQCRASTGEEPQAHAPAGSSSTDSPLQCSGSLLKHVRLDFSLCPAPQHHLKHLLARKERCWAAPDTSLTPGATSHTSVPTPRPHPPSKLSVLLTLRAFMNSC